MYPKALNFFHLLLYFHVEFQAKRCIRYLYSSIQYDHARPRKTTLDLERPRWTSSLTEYCNQRVEFKFSSVRNLVWKKDESSGFLP